MSKFSHAADDARAMTIPQRFLQKTAKLITTFQILK